MSKIYTRTGDKGTTGLYGGRRVRKDDLRVEAYGTVDELNSVIGVVFAEVQNSKRKTHNYSSKVKSELTKIQGDLFEIGAVLATPARVRKKEKRIHEQFGEHLKNRVLDFEKFIDELISKLLPLTTFILPGGAREGATLHLARSVCRRAERRIVALAQREHVSGEIIMYINRLSDLLFTMARFINKQKQVSEKPWRGLK